MSEENIKQPNKSISELVNEYKNKGELKKQTINVTPTSIPSANHNPNEHYNQVMNKETDPDLIISFELIKLPSKGVFYPHGIDEVKVEYMTSKDEDLLTTPSLIENGTVLDVLLKRKVKTPEIIVDDLLPGDRNAILLFLRTSSYGSNYDVQVADPRSGVPFKSSVDLLKLKYKEPNELPDSNGLFNVDLPMRKRNVLFKLLSSGEDNRLYKKAESIKEAYGNEFSEYNTMKLKAQVVSIDGNQDVNYIGKFIDAMPALDSFTIRRKTMDVQPDVDMGYEFTASDGFKFITNLTIGIDFFFPTI